LWTLDEISRALGTALTQPGAGNVVPRAISIDTRTLQPGDLFLALAGERFDGHAFVARAFERGASGAIVRRDRAAGGGVLVPVDDPLDALWRLAARARAESAARVVAVTGSNGKTTTREMIASSIDTEDHVLRPAGNRNNHIGLPLTLVELAPVHRWAVLEMGMNHPGEIDALSRLARPHLAVITNVGRAHVGPVGGLEAIRDAKLEIVTGLTPQDPLLVPSWDAALVHAARARHARVLTFGPSEGADFRIERLEPSHGTGYVVALERGPEVRLSAPGRGVALAAALALAVVRALGGDEAAVAKRLAAYVPVPGRLAVRRALGYTVLDDTYNASPESMALALDTLRETAPAGRRIAVLGDMLELGPDSKALHRELAAGLGGLSAVYLVGEETNETLDAARDLHPGLPVRHFDDVGALAAALREEIGAEDVILVKASHGMRLDRIVSALVPPGEAPDAV